MAKKNNTNKTTSSEVAKKASDVLQDEQTGKKSKTAAGSALSQTKTSDKSTSEKAATASSKVLKDGRTADDSKSSAGSALSQKEPKKKSPVKSDALKKK